MWSIEITHPQHYNRGNCLTSPLSPVPTLIFHFSLTHTHAPKLTHSFRQYTVSGEGGMFAPSQFSPKVLAQAEEWSDFPWNGLQQKTNLSGEAQWPGWFILVFSFLTCSDPMLLSQSALIYTDCWKWSKQKRTCWCKREEFWQNATRRSHLSV